MQFTSFPSANPIYVFGRARLSFEIITLENVYSLDVNHISFQPDNYGDFVLRCDQLTWAGGQQTAPGSLLIVGQGTGGQLRLNIEARAPGPIRAIKIRAHDLPLTGVLDMLDAERAVPDAGLLDKYPNPLRLPVWIAALEGGERLGFRWPDPLQRPKRFAAYLARPAVSGQGYTIECIHEEDARHFDTPIRAPTFVMDWGVEPAAFREEQLAFNEAELGLRPWAARDDVPVWTRDIHLVLTLHGMHWSGYIFNTYAGMLDIIRYVTERLDGRHVLAYLPGWEGRYYWQYGDYRPEPLLGGADGFEQLCYTARSLGVKVMPMFGANCANAWARNFHTFGPSSYMKSATRNVFHGNQPDWDTSRAQDTGWQAWLNPGAPAWQTELTRQIIRLTDEYALDAVFLDTVEVWVNDPDFNLREGYRQLVDRLRAGRPDLLVTGEDWWDGLLPMFPIFQHTPQWRAVPDWVGRYARLMGHICDGDPARGSTGVFESGYHPYQRLPDRPFYLPTLPFVDGTLDRARDEVDAVIALAQARAAGG